MPAKMRIGRTPAIISKEYLANRGRPAEMTEEIARMWDGMQVVDATFDLVINLSSVDFEHAKAQDFFHCAFAEAVRAQFHSTNILFAPTVAYIDLDMDGKGRKVYRFYLSAAARRMVIDFDKATPEERAAMVAKAGSNFTLRKPSSKMTLKSLREADRERRERKRIMVGAEPSCDTGLKKKKAKKEAKEKKVREKRVREAIIKGTARKRGFSILNLSDVRDARGLIQFRVGEVKTSKLKAAAKHKVA